ncbi:MAG: cobalt chelatase [Acidimicrobiia bacterium]|nr:cobalt chelatase [Acidimicrobiia bacterium]
MGGGGPTPSGTSRLLDRLTSAAVRAVGAEPMAELRGGRVEIAGRPMTLAVPHLVGDLTGAELFERRGVADALGLRIRHSDLDLHRRLTPIEPLERIVFDIAEQFRCEALAPLEWRGSIGNRDRAFERWNESAQVGRLIETGVGLLIFTVTQMLRQRLLGRATTERVDDLIETTRGNLARLIGHALAELPALITDQAAFAAPAREIARLVAEMAGDAAELRVDRADDRARLLIPIDWDAIDYELSGADGPSPAAPGTDSYRAFTTAHDRVTTGEALYRPRTLRSLRTRLNELQVAQTVSAARLALRLQALFAADTVDHWVGGFDSGRLDSSRLARLVVDPVGPIVYRRPLSRPAADTVVTFLVDTSGSMKVQRHESLAVLIDTLVRALEMAGVASEVLGFTTSTWSGGRSADDWRAAGAPGDPGRVADVLHIVYKSADQTWRQARMGLAAIFRTDHYREGVDGEAVRWATNRLAAREERRRVLVLVSDGLPMETATARLNPDGYLLDHLAAEWQRAATLVEVGAISLDHDLSAVLAPSVTVNLTGTLTVGTYSVLDTLFG